MTRFIITAAALMIGTSAFAQVAGETKTATTYGASSTVIAVGDHYTVQSVSADGTVTVKTVTGEEALALAAPANVAMLSPR